MKYGPWIIQKFKNKCNKQILFSLLNLNWLLMLFIGRTRSGCTGSSFDKNKIPQKCPYNISDPVHNCPRNIFSRMPSGRRANGCTQDELFGGNWISQTCPLYGPCPKRFCHRNIAISGMDILVLLGSYLDNSSIVATYL